MGEKEIFPRYYQRTHPLIDESREGRVNLARTTCIQKHKMPAKDTLRILYNPSFNCALGSIVGVDKYREGAEKWAYGVRCGSDSAVPRRP